MSVAKALVVFLWVVFATAFFVATGSTTSFLGRAAFWMLVIAHAIECAVFLPVLRRAPGSLAGNLARTFVFGFLHVREVRALTRQEPSQP